ncbi:MAG TPA: type I-E CRISPR-associated protein Cas7/Cse4/CasC, partial [bacterium]|nr:type I-E CRISPR-associated protein Cas7/Cse4/CasC [bacterium]
MSEFIQIHMLASYPPSNLNRDDLGRPKTATVGGTQRIRVSSQSLKRSWRTSEAFSDALKGTIGIRTKIMGVKIKKALVEGRLLSDILEGK